MTRTEDDNEWPTLRPGDEVEVVLPGVVTPTGVIKPTNTDYRFDPGWLRTTGARVVVTRPFNHPSRDLVGTVRRTTEGQLGIFIKTARSNFDGLGVADTWWDIINGDEMHDDDVVEAEVIGVTPGTPAWDEQVAKEGDHT
jgi:hypothetical protein